MLLVPGLWVLTRSIASKDWQGSFWATRAGGSRGQCVGGGWDYWPQGPSPTRLGPLKAISWDLVKAPKVRIYCNEYGGGGSNGKNASWIWAYHNTKRRKKSERSGDPSSPLVDMITYYSCRSKVRPHPNWNKRFRAQEESVGMAAYPN